MPGHKSFYNTFSITTDAHPNVTYLHDRVPVILAANEREEWIGNESFMLEVLTRKVPELVWSKAGKVTPRIIC